MKELRKINQLEESYSEIDTSCEVACDIHYGPGCACDYYPQSVETEEYILF